MSLYELEYGRLVVKKKKSPAFLLAGRVFQVKKIFNNTLTS